MAYATENKCTYDSVWLLTLPRFFKRVFNPVSFYFFCEGQTIKAVLAEVTNTYHDKHTYWISNQETGKFIKNCQEKTFHVSPFLEEEGHYLFTIGKQLNNIEIHISYTKGNTVKFYANMIQKDVLPMSLMSTLKTTLQFPGAALSVLPRILIQALKLNILKHVPAHKRPIPHHSHTFQKRPPSWFESFCKNRVLDQFKKLQIGQLLLTLPDGQKLTFGTGQIIDMVVHDYRFFKYLVLHGEIGLGEAYVDGLWDTSNVVEVLSLFIRNDPHIKSHTKGQLISILVHGIQHALNKNSIQKTTENIFEHYDIGNAFYALFLDKNMMYSSGLFLKSTDSLEQAQLQKIDALIDNLHITSECHILEIGTGWGGAAIRVAEKTGCKVTTLTVSKAQYEYAIKHIKQANLSDKITVLLQDYRDHKGHYDRIMSIEMIEAVGYDFLPDYFKALENLSKPNTIIGIQAILIPDQRYETYRYQSDWIKKYIFPGGHMPCLHHIQSILKKKTQLMLHKVTPMGFSYAKTLRCWQERFLAQLDTVKQQGFDHEFIRKWTYYLNYCEAGFKTHYIQVSQLIITHPTNTTLVQNESKL